MRGPYKGFSGHMLTVLLATIVSAAFVVVLLSNSGTFGPGPGGDLRLVMRTSAGLATQARVTVAGQAVGRVQDVERRGRASVVTVHVDEKHWPLPDDTRALIRLRTVVGEKSVELEPGVSERMLTSGAVIPLRQTENIVEIDQILSQIRGPRRARARQVLRSLGYATKGNGDRTNALMAGVAGTIDEGTPVVERLARDREQITGIVENLGALASQVGERGRAVEELAGGLDATFAGISRQQTAVGEVLAELPVTLASLRSISGTVREVTAGATPVIRKAARAVDGLRGTVQGLRPAANQGRALVRELGRAAGPLDTTLTTAEEAANPLAAALPKAQRVLCELNPTVRYIAPYAPEVTSVISGLASAVNSYDRNGHIARLYLGVGTNSVIGLMPPAVATSLDSLTKAGLLANVTLLGYNPYPAPGKVNETTVGRNSTGPHNAENEYVRVQADC